MARAIPSCRRWHSSRAASASAGAKALSAHVGVRAWRAGSAPKPGVLLGCKRYRAGVPHFARGATLAVTARVSYEDESGFAAYDCAIASAGERLAEGTLKAYAPAD